MEPRQILFIVLKLLPPSPSSQPQVDALVVDGPAIIHMIRPGLCVTIDEYIKTKFHPYILSQLNNVYRIDLVWDVYHTESLKYETRQARGSGIEV